MVIALAVYWPTSTALWSVLPRDGGQGFLVVAIALWLFIRARDRMRMAPVRPLPLATLLLLPCSIAAVILWKAGIQTLHLMLLRVLVLLAVLAAFGPAVARTVAVPIGYLYFAVPAWNFLAVPLQSLTLRMVALLAAPLGLPASVAGSLVSFPNGATFEVTTLCSGVGFLVQGLAVAVLLGELEQASLARRLRLVGSMLIVALVSNWIRVLVIMEIGYTTGMRHVLVTRDHLLFGSVLFILVLVVFVWAATRRALPPRQESASGARGPRTVPLVPGYLMTVAALCAAPFVVYASTPTPDDRATANELRLPTGRADWRGPLAIADATWRPVFVGQHAQMQVKYTDLADRDVEVVAIGYTLQAQGRELVNEGNSLVGDSGLRILSAQVIELEGQAYVEQLAVDGLGHRSVIWSIYNIGGRTFTRPLLSQLWYAVRSLNGSPYSVLFAFKAQCSPSCDAAQATLGAFVRGMGAELLATAAQASRSDRRAGPA